MQFPGLNPKLLEAVLGQLGLARGQIESIDSETKRLFLGLFFKALGSGNANAYLKVRLQYLADSGDDFARGATEPSPPPRPEPRVEVVDREPRPHDGGARWRRKAP